MTASPLLQSLVMAVHPHSRGLGWVLFEGPIAPADWGIVDVKNDKNARCLARIEQILDRYEPSVLVLEQFDRRPSRRGARVKELCAAIVHLCANRGIEYCVYNRAVIRTCFVTVGARTRYEIAKAVALHIHALRRHLPPTRRSWQSEDRRQSLFDAAALAMTHFAVKADRAAFNL